MPKLDAIAAKAAKDALKAQEKRRADAEVSLKEDVGAAGWVYAGFTASRDPDDPGSPDDYSAYRQVNGKTKQIHAVTPEELLEKIAKYDSHPAMVENRVKAWRTEKYTAELEERRAKEYEIVHGYRPDEPAKKRSRPDVAASRGL